MARRFIELDEAAKMLGMSPDTLNELRERQKVHGYRDGASWKFKQEEIERLMAERASADVEDEGEYAEIDEDPDSILLSEVELGQSDESTSSTIIGGRSSRDPAESDIQLAQPKHDSDVNLDSALSLDPSTGSDVLGGSDVEQGGSGVSPMFDELDTLDLDLPSAADSGISSKILTDVPQSPESSGTVMAGEPPQTEGSGLGMASEDELALGEAGDDDEHLLDVPDGGSAIDLTAEADDDLVLGGSSHGDLSRTGDSGISLLDPSDSGLSLESQPLELGGSAVESLDLGDDDMILTEDEAEAAERPAAAEADDELGDLGELGEELGGDLGDELGGELGDLGAATEEQSDDDFLLTPLEEAGVEESDSGSQVIALDEDVEFEEAAPGASGIGAGLLEDDLGEGLGAATLGSEALAPAPMQTTVQEMAPAGGPAAAGATVPEATFSGWNVAALGTCAVLLLFVGMFMFDLLRNMWSWNETYSVNSTLMDMVLGWFEG